MLGLVGAAVAAIGAPAAATGYSMTDLGSLGYGVSVGFGVTGLITNGPVAVPSTVPLHPSDG